jgi:hypothetical protein
MLRCAIVMLLAAMGLLLTACDRQEAQRGRQLFFGEVPLAARIEGHSMTLPTQASRCSNCHTLAAVAALAQPAASQPIGGSLAADRLTAAVSRRGGPPSRFDKGSLCRLLRTGVDPAFVIIPKVMPRYELADADCDALWAFLRRTRDAHAIESPPGS